MIYFNRMKNEIRKQIQAKVKSSEKNTKMITQGGLWALKIFVRLMYHFEVKLPIRQKYCQLIQTRDQIKQLQKMQKFLTGDFKI